MDEQKDQKLEFGQRCPAWCGAALSHGGLKVGATATVRPGLVLAEHDAPRVRTRHKPINGLAFGPYKSHCPLAGSATHLSMHVSDDLLLSYRFPITPPSRHGTEDGAGAR